MMNKNKPTRHIIKRNAVKLMAIGLLAVLTTTATVPDLGEPVMAAELTDSKVQSYEDQIAYIEAEMEKLQGQISQSQQDLSSAMINKQNIDNEIKLLSDKIELTRQLIVELDNNIATTSTAIDEKQAEYDRQYELFKERLRITHEEGEANYLEMLFGAESLSDFLSRVDRIGAFLEYDTMVMDKLLDMQTSLENEKATYEETRAKQTELYNDLVASEAEMTAKSQEAASYITQLQLNAAQMQSLEAQNEQMRNELEQELEDYLKELEAKQNSKYVGGTFMWPVPTTYTYVSSECVWRTSPITGRAEFHNGLDIPADFGTDVYASNSGTVIKSTYHYSYGYYIMIDHGGGFVTLYAHNSKLLVSVGDTVAKGQVIAKVGSTGDSTGNHCHFTMYQNGAVIDPRIYFPA